MSTPGCVFVSAFLLGAGVFQGAVAQTGAPVGRGQQVQTPPLIDGRIDDRVWASAERLSGFVQNEPFEGRPATERTEIMILFDEDAIYIGARMFDSDARQIVTGETRRDAGINDTDALLIVLDTYLDRQNGFVFGTTPAGIEYDGQVTGEGQGGSGGGFRPGQRTQAGSGGGFNVNWDGSWDVATFRDADGWYAEFRIPFTTLRYRGGGEQTWGLNISRNIRRKNEQSFWAPVPRQFGLYRVSQAGSFSLEAPLRRTITVSPYGLASTSRDYTVVTPGEFDEDIEFGGDIKVGLTSSLTLDLTVNTDFAQVEVDDQQVNLTRFRLFFPEKRPFFLENAGTFSVGSPQSADLFFSRRIGIENGTAVPILGGGRVSGKIGGLTVGLLNIQTDDVPGITDPNNFSVARVFREFPNRTRIGAMAVGRVNTDSTTDDNWTYAVDGRVGVGDGLTLDGYVAKSETPGRTGRQDAFQVGARYNARDWLFQASYRQIGADFNPEVGFLTRSADEFFSVRIQRNMRFEGMSWFRELRPHISVRRNKSMVAGSIDETRVVHIDSHFEFSDGAFFQLPATNLTREGFDDPFEIAPGIIVPAGIYDNAEIGFAYNTNLSAPVSVRGRITAGGFLTGNRRGSDVTVTVRAGEALALGARVDYNDVNLAEGDFESFLTSLRAAYSFTPRVYVQSLLQFNNQSDTFSSNIRFGWLSTAGTGLFVVYNDIERTADLLGRRLGVSDWQPEARGLIVKFTQQFNLSN